jgi:hypothetical protein
MECSRYVQENPIKGSQMQRNSKAKSQTEETERINKYSNNLPDFQINQYRNVNKNQGKIKRKRVSILC